jgi:hypothetical protein
MEIMRIFLFILLLCSTYRIFGQKDSEYNASPDSLRTSVKEHYTLPFIVKPGFIIPLSSLNRYPLSLKMGLYSFTPFPENNTELNTDLLYPSLNLNVKYKISFLYTLLGAAQLGAVGYMAYKHVKKYGLFK